jgi:hypothetical protein
VQGIGDNGGIVRRRIILVGSGILIFFTAM